MNKPESHAKELQSSPEELDPPKISDSPKKLDPPSKPPSHITLLFQFFAMSNITYIIIILSLISIKSINLINLKINSHRNLEIKTTVFVSTPKIPITPHIKNNSCILASETCVINAIKTTRIKSKIKYL